MKYVIPSALCAMTEMINLTFSMETGNGNICGYPWQESWACHGKLSKLQIIQMLTARKGMNTTVADPTGSHDWIPQAWNNAQRIDVPQLVQGHGLFNFDPFLISEADLCLPWPEAHYLLELPSLQSHYGMTGPGPQEPGVQRPFKTSTELAPCLYTVNAGRL